MDGSPRGVVPASTSAISRRPVGLDGANPEGVMPPIRKPRPAPSGRDLRDRDDDATRTSDRWTDETIPSLR
jgi:hypothetical protein